MLILINFPLTILYFSQMHIWVVSDWWKFECENHLWNVISFTHRMLLLLLFKPKTKFAILVYNKLNAFIRLFGCFYLIGFWLHSCLLLTTLNSILILFQHAFVAPFQKSFFPMSYVVYFWSINTYRMYRYWVS